MSLFFFAPDKSLINQESCFKEISSKYQDKEDKLLYLLYHDKDDLLEDDMESSLSQDFENTQNDDHLTQEIFRQLSKDYPDKVPVAFSEELLQTKYLFPRNWTIEILKLYLRTKFDLECDYSILLLVGDEVIVQPQDQELLGNVFDNHSESAVLRLHLSIDSGICFQYPFGKMFY